jgi:predicted nucleotidyltransferase
MRKEIPPRLDKIIHDYARGLYGIYGDKLMSVTLFGSYARGDFTEDSDIDVFLIVDASEDALREYSDALCDFTATMNVENGVDLAPIVVSRKSYRYWRNVHPLYQEIRQDGVVIYNAA